MKKGNLFCAGLFLILPLLLHAQKPPAYAVENVTIHKADGSVIQSGTIVWRDGVIESVGRNTDTPYDAYTIDGGDSLHVYPGFIDGLGTWGSPDLPESPGDVDEPGNPGYTRAGIEPQRTARHHLNVSADELNEILKQGVTTASLGLKGYMLPGSSDLFFLNGKDTEGHLFQTDMGMQFAFEGAPGGWGSRAYPSTTMGVMARFRQLMYDAEALKVHMGYYASTDGAMPAPRRDRVLESLFPVMDRELKVLAAVDSPEDIDRMLILKDEFDFDVVIVSGKNASYSVDELNDRNIPVLASIELPEKPDWMKAEEEEDEEASEPSGEEEVRYRERQRDAYKNAATNIKILLDSGVEVGFASLGMEADKFREHVTGLKENGELSEEEIIRLLTVNTASVLGVESKMGELETGKIASFTLFTSPYFEEEAKAQMVISNGVIHEF